MKIFVTGGSGFIGGHVIEALCGAHEVVAMARSAGSAAKVERFGARPLTCSLGAVEPATLAGVDAIVHCAAFVEEWGTREQFWSVNVDGTTQLLDAARQAGVSRFVHIGTEAALFDGHDLIDVDERQPYPPRQRFLYSETKAEAERRVLAANQPGFRTVSVRPRLVWGPRDGSVLPAVLRVLDSGQWRFIDGGRQQTSSTHVANLVHGVTLALSCERDIGGQAFFVADAERSTLRSFLSALVATAGRTLPDRSIPGPLARTLAFFIESTWRTLRLTGAPPMTRFGVSMMSRSVTVNCAKAETQLGYHPIVSVQQGMAELRANRDTVDRDAPGEPNVGEGERFASE